MLAIDAFENSESLLLELSSFREQLFPNLIKLCGFVETLANSNVDEEDKKLLKTYVLLLKFKIAALEGGNVSFINYAINLFPLFFFNDICTLFKFWYYLVFSLNE